MLHFYDRATMTSAMRFDIDPALKALLHARIKGLSSDLLDYTEYLIVEPGDTEDDMVRNVGFSLLVEPIDGARYGSPGFVGCWDWLISHEGWFELIVTFGSTFAYVFFVKDADGVDPELRAMCRNKAT